MSLIIPANSLAGGGYAVDNSLRFNSASSDYLNRTISTGGNRQIMTFSAWVKRATASNTTQIFTTGTGGERDMILFESGGQIQFSRYNGSYIYHLKTNRLFRDTSAWYHIVAIFNSTEATSSNRMKLYINGVQETSFSTETYPSLNYNSNYNQSTFTQYVGVDSDGNGDFDGYMSEVYNIDGQALTPTDFGEFDADSGVWKPIAYTGTYGTNGFFLEFQSSGALGTDSSGNANTFTVNNLTSIDQTTDTPTNNFATLNPLDNYYANSTFSEGNLTMTSGSGREASNTATFALSNGKWYWETKIGSIGAPFIGIQPVPSFNNTASAAVLQTNGFGILKTGKVETSNGSGGSTVLASYSTFTTNDIIGTALDLNANKIYFYKNGSILGAGGVTITDPASTTNGHYFIGFGSISGQSTFEINFGGTQSFTISSGNADANGYGNFEYAVPSGYYALCTKNLAEYG
jgi:hypothetical protein